MSFWVGIDPGERRIGVAVSDPLGMLASPRGVLGSEADLVARLVAWEAEGELHGVVIGLPRNMSGTIGPIGARSIALVRRLREQLGVPIYLWDERLTTEQVLRGQATRTKRSVDERAAAVLLQSYLDAGCPRPPDPPEERVPAPPPGG